MSIDLHRLLLVGRVYSRLITIDRRMERTSIEGEVGNHACRVREKDF